MGKKGEGRICGGLVGNEIRGYRERIAILCVDIRRLALSSAVSVETIVDTSHITLPSGLTSILRGKQSSGAAMSHARPATLSAVTSQVVAQTEEYELIELGSSNADYDLEQASNEVNASASIITASPATPYALDEFFRRRIANSTNGCSYVIYRIANSCSAALMSSANWARDRTTASRDWLQNHGCLQLQPTGNACCDTVFPCDDGCLLACSLISALACAVTGTFALATLLSNRPSATAAHRYQGGSYDRGGSGRGSGWGGADFEGVDAVPKLPSLDERDNDDYMVVEQDSAGEDIPVLLLRRRRLVREAYVPEPAMTAE